MHMVDHGRPLEFPGVAEAQPFVRIFLLPALRDDLAEQAEIVADAIADGGNRQRRHALHEARREPSQPTIAERGVRFAFAQIRQGDAEIAKCGLEHREQTHIVQGVGKQPADQELQAQIVDPFASRVIAVLIDREPVVHDAVAQRQRCRLVPVVPGRHADVLADRKPELREDRALDLGQGQLVDGLVERGKIGRERWIGQPFTSQHEFPPNDTRLGRGSKPAESSVCASLCMILGKYRADLPQSAGAALVI